MIIMIVQDESISVFFVFVLLFFLFSKLVLSSLLGRTSTYICFLDVVLYHPLLLTPAF